MIFIIFQIRLVRQFLEISMSYIWNSACVYLFNTLCIKLWYYLNEIKFRWDWFDDTVLSLKWTWVCGGNFWISKIRSVFNQKQVNWYLLRLIFICLKTRVELNLQPWSWFWNLNADVMCISYMSDIIRSYVRIKKKKASQFVAFWA